MNAFSPASLTQSLLQDLLEDVKLAPSVHNIQPARWRLLDAGLELLGDTSRMIPVADPAARDWRLSLGAAWEGMALALAHRGLGFSATEIMPPEAPENRSGGHLVPVAQARIETATESFSLQKDIHARASWRGPFRPADASTHAALDRLAAARDDLHLIRDAAALADIATLADRAGMHFLRDPEHRRELLHWMRLSKSHPGYDRDGLNAEAMNLGALEAQAAGLVLGPLFRPLDAIGLAAPLVSEAGKNRSAAAIALFHRPSGEDAFVSGRAFYRAWLAMEEQALRACPVSVLADWPPARTALAAGQGLPAGRAIISVFRLGRPAGDAPSVHARLPVAELAVPGPVG